MASALLEIERGGAHLYPVSSPHVLCRCLEHRLRRATRTQVDAA